MVGGLHHHHHHHHMVALQRQPQLNNIQVSTNGMVY